MNVLRIKLISGGQTGVDRAALDIARELGLDSGGWCPRGRRAEDGRIPKAYPLQETPSSRYSQRTQWNIRDSEATLILCQGRLTGGTALTLQLAGKMGRPHRVIDLSLGCRAPEAVGWLVQLGAEVINVAGPRESQVPGIKEAASDCLRLIFQTTR